MKRIKTIYKVSYANGEKFTKTKRVAIKKAKRMAEKYGETIWIDKYAEVKDCRTKRRTHEGTAYVRPSIQAKVARKLRGN